ncbi:divergent PAP2 family protein [Candidatus Kuenenbacteria bacterium]|nr:divergent PAP2 family protein [Candidatus Kuenenbacteria bacterium]
MSYQLILIPLIAAIIAQIIKLIINGIKGQFTWKDLNSYGGMPSSHAALVTALFAMAGYFEGWDSAAAALALILGIIVIRDAGGFRQVLGRHAQELNQLIHNLKSTESYKYPHLKERMGHTPLELFFGSLVGAVIVVSYILIF